MSKYNSELKKISSIKNDSKILFISADFNREYISQHEDIIEEVCKENGLLDISKVIVPGALEIPAMLNRILIKKDYDLVFCLGVVIRGETTHYEIVSNESAKAIMDMAIKFPNTGIINGILTCENEKQVKERINEHIAISGLNLLNEISKLG